MAAWAEDGPPSSTWAALHHAWDGIGAPSDILAVLDLHSFALSPAESAGSVLSNGAARAHNMQLTAAQILKRDSDHCNYKKQISGRRVALTCTWWWGHLTKLHWRHIGPASHGMSLLHWCAIKWLATPRLHVLSGCCFTAVVPCLLLCLVNSLPHASVLPTGCSQVGTIGHLERVSLLSY